MTTYGITLEGFVLKRLPEIKKEMEDDFRAVFGDSINLDARTPEGQLIGIFSERESLIWEKMEQLYYAAYPDTAEGVPLDNSVAITGTKRRPSTYSTLIARIIGVEGTVIPNTFIGSVQNNPDAKFKLDSEATIAAGVSEVQKLVYSAVPTSGVIAYVYGGNQTVDLDFNATVGEIETALEALEGIDDVSITGNYSIGHTITFVGDSANIPFDLLTIGSNTLDNGGAITVTITEETAGKYPEATGKFTATTKGAVQAPTNSFIVIDTPINGVESIVNDEDATLGDETELDADLKNRRETEIAQAGKATVDAIRASISEVSGVTSVLVFNNRENFTDGFGRPPHSVDCVVEGGVNQDIANDIWDVIGAGPTMFGDISETVVDSNGFNQTVKFSRPTDINIWVEVDLTTDVNFPDDGIALVEAAILEYGNNLEIGDDVIVYTPLVSAIGTVDGITDLVIRVGTTDTPTTDDNIIIGEREKADFDSARITAVEV